MDVVLHFGLESLGDLSLGCMLLLCKHDHFKSARINHVVHSRWYRYGTLALFNLVTSIITVQAIG